MNSPEVSFEQLAALLESDAPLVEVAQDYLERQDDPFRTRVVDGMRDVLRTGNCTPAFMDQRDAVYWSSTPVEVESEGRFIGPALIQHASEQQAPPRRILLLANYVDGVNWRVEQGVERAKEFIAANPSVPVGLVEREYPEPQTIGSLRRDAAGVLLGLATESSVRTDALHVNDDIDSVRRSRYFSRDMFRVFSRGGRLVTDVYPQVRHALSHQEGGNQPNMDTVIAWYDLASTITDRVRYDLGNGISVRAYCLTGGYDPRSAMDETHSILGRIDKLLPQDVFTAYRCRSARLVTSARRLREKLYGHFTDQPVDFWPKEDFEYDKFAVEATYRVRDTAQLRDIGPGLRDAQVRYLAAKTQAALGLYHAGRYPDKEAQRRIRRTLQVAQLLLGGPADLLAPQ